ncbi:MAG: hypothetical protein BroJett040_17070 [Oligoflexia bacterium]|nr:MAG: hypothetical protein BroJett040_17070 [Oligoflexia bacterium]
MRVFLSTVWTAVALFGSLSFAQPPVLPEGLRSLMSYEQQVNRNIDETRVQALTNNQNKKFAPESGKWFQVKSYWVEAETVFLFSTQTSLSQAFTSDVGNKKYVLFLVHPESEDFYANFLRDQKPGPLFHALATSSSRTVLVSPEGRPDVFFFAKLSLNKEIGGVVRTIPKGEIARSVGTTNVLISSKSYIGRDFDFLLETVGVMPKGMERGGFLIREIPQDVISGRSQLLPMFSLFTRQESTGKSPFELMIQKTKREPLEFIRDEILRPFAKLWLDVTVKNGIAIEAHGQNFLMEISDGLPTGKFVFRDFGGFNLDLHYRGKKGFPSLELPALTNLAEDYHQKFHATAIRQSLFNYFEAGVLYGLADEAERFQSGISYKRLTFEFRKILSQEAQSYGMIYSPNDAMYMSLEDLVMSARRQMPPRIAPLCSRVAL